MPFDFGVAAAASSVQGKIGGAIASTLDDIWRLLGSLLALATITAVLSPSEERPSQAITLVLQWMGAPTDLLHPYTSWLEADSRRSVVAWVSLIVMGLAAVTVYHHIPRALGIALHWRAASTYAIASSILVEAYPRRILAGVLPHAITTIAIWLAHRFDDARARDVNHWHRSPLSDFRAAKIAAIYLDFVAAVFYAPMVIALALFGGSRATTPE